MIGRILLFAVLLPEFVLAQQPSNAKKAATATSPPPKPQGLTIDGIVSMVEAGISEDVIIARLRKDDKAFDLGSDDLIRLKKAKVSDSVLKVMMDPKAELKVAAPVPAPAPPPQPAPVSAPTPVVIQAPGIPSIAVPSPSGATPAAGSTASGDPNDPLTPHDSGIFLYTKDRDGKPEMVVLERAAYQGSKTGGIFTSAVTYGIKKIKTKAVLPGPRASIRTNEGTPVFYFYFDDKAAGLGRSYFGGASVSNPNQFALLKLEVTRSNRETMIGSMNAFGSSSGSDAKSMTAVKSERIRPGLYKVVPSEPLRPGEYCFLASGAFTGAYAAGSAGVAVDIFDFGINPNE